MSVTCMYGFHKFTEGFFIEQKVAYWLVTDKKGILQYLITTYKVFMWKNKIFIETSEPKMPSRVGLISREYDKGPHYHPLFLTCIWTVEQIGKATF